MSDTATVLVVDDDASIREALEGLIRSIGLKAMTFASVAEFLAAKRPDGPCCLVLDVRMPGQSGLDLQAELIKAGVQLPVIFITGHGDIPMTVRAMKAGAVEFLPKPFRDQDLLDAIAVAIERDKVNRSRAEVEGELREKFSALTTREREVMGLVASGLLNKQIAAELGVSEITVKVHRGQVMRKLGARTVADLVRIAERLGGAGAAS